MKLKDIKKNPDNPRVLKNNKFKKLVKSIEDFPQMMELRPIVVDENGVVLGGNMRYAALEYLGKTEIPDSWVKRADELTEEQKKEFIIKDNVGFGDWDLDLLENEWDTDLLADWGLDLAFPEKSVKEDDYEEGEEGLGISIEYGDLIEIGEHRLLCGDCTKKEDLEKLMEGEKADLVVTDPPYNVDYTGRGKEKLKIKNDKMEDSRFYDFLLSFYSNLNEHVKPGGVWYVWHADSEGTNFRRAMMDAGIQVKQCLIWVKNSMVLGRQDYQWQHEPCLYGWTSGGSHYWGSDRKQTTVLNFDRPLRNKEYPTMKPVELIAYQIGNSSKRKDIVCDVFIGSGTTMVAAHELGRLCYSMELDPKYCKVVVERMLNLEPNLEVKINGELLK